MDLLDIRALMKTTHVTNIALRVTFYARVSSEKDAQLNSLDNQISFFTDFIQSNPKWTYVPGYIDEGLSGMAVTKRENFLRMISDAEEQKFDLIVTKEISRFARNTIDSIQYTRQLLRCGVGVLFRNDGINTLEEMSEFRLTMMAGMAQDEIERLSSRVKFGHEQAIKKGVVLGNSLMFGFDKKDGRLVINEAEAPMVRKLFELYATGQYGLKELVSILYADGYRNHNGVEINHSTLSKIIANPKYKGWYVGGKVKITDMITKKQRFMPPEKWTMYKDETGEIVPAIVSEELWDRCNAILSTRSGDVKKRQNQCTHENLLTGKLICTHCGAPYHRKESVDKYGHRNSRWACSNKLTKGASACPSIYLFESEIKPLLLDVFRESITSVDEFMDGYEQFLNELYSDTTLDTETAKLEKTRDGIHQRKQKLLTLCVEGRLTDGDFERMNKELSTELEGVETALTGLVEQQKTRGSAADKIKAARAAMEGAKKAAESGSITREFVEQNIDKVFVTPVDAHMMHLEVRLKTQQTIEKTVIRTGYTFKKMITDYQNQASGK
jgi:DNA invertase Pin-like site-specific DNA recombinase